MPSGLRNADRRLCWLLAGFVVVCATISGRLVALELHDGAAIRTEATRPTLRARALPAMRGRILARDGTVLACDQPLAALAVQYHWLQEPPDPRWLRLHARSRLTAAERRRPERVAEEIEQVIDERAAMHKRLAELCGLSPDEWRERCGRIQSHVQELSDRANRRMRSGTNVATESDNSAAVESWLAIAGRRLFDGLFRTSEPPPEPIVVAEELRDHVLFEGLSLEAVARIEESPEQFPGVRIVHASRRLYPAGSLAAHSIGYVGPARESDANAPTTAEQKGDGDEMTFVGGAGVERHYDALLAGEPGRAVETLDHHGRAISSEIERPAAPGRDLVLSLDPALQQAAETLLDAALARRLETADDQHCRADGGAVIAMDVRTGEILAAASAPRFEPAALAEADSGGANQSKLRDYLGDPAHPLFDRAVQMALPPGSVFKTLSAIALLDSAGFDPRQPFDCQGFLHSPDRLRCEIYRRTGMGHGPVTLVDALAQSCNVYFFHYAEEFGPAALVDWGERFGFGRPTGIDLPGESAGRLPSPGAQAAPKADKTWRTGDTESLAIGQGSLTATPLQVVRMMAAVANGGFLVTPHVAQRLQLSAADSDDTASAKAAIDQPPPRPIWGLELSRLAIVREGLRRVVADPRGTGHATVRLEGIEIAGKTGTAETSPGQADHAWFAGYAPAESPRVAFVVVLEHAGDASATAGPVARRLVEKLQELGYLGAGAAQFSASSASAADTNPVP